MSRFDHDFLVYTQSRAGYDFGPVQLYWNGNVTVDAKRQDWANFVETGPGLRVPVAQSMYLTFNLLRGAYLIDNPSRRAHLQRCSRRILVCVYSLASWSSPAWRGSRRIALLQRALRRRRGVARDPRRPSGCSASPPACRGSSWRAPAPSASAEWPARVERGAILILEGESSLADLFGFRRVRTRTRCGCRASPTCTAPACPSSGRRGSSCPCSTFRRARRCSPANAGPARR